METNLNDKVEDEYLKLENEIQLKEKDEELAREMEGEKQDQRIREKEQTKPEDLICSLCGGKEIETEHDVGSDVDPEGEETQHIDRCKKCGAWRFNIDRWENFTTYQKIYGKWRPKETDFHI